MKKQKLSKKSSISDIEKTLMDIAIKIAKQEKGCLFVIKKNSLSYEPLLHQDVKPFPILENQRRLETLALLDGACIIDEKGYLIAYAVQIKKTKTFIGFGTRHAAGYTASLNGNISILCN